MLLQLRVAFCIIECMNSNLQGFPTDKCNEITSGVLFKLLLLQAAEVTVVVVKIFAQNSFSTAPPTACGALTLLLIRKDIQSVNSFIPAIPKGFQLRALNNVVGNLRKQRVLTKAKSMHYYSLTPVYTGQF